MCTAYKVGKVVGELAAQTQAAALEYLLGIDQERIVRPTHRAPVLMPDGSVQEMIWGFRRKVPAVKSRTRWQTIVNSREDKLGGPTWNAAFRERRCLIPASGFFEWVPNPAGGMRPLLFEDPSRATLWIAGIWEEDKERGACYSMITTDPNALVAPVHDRMPAVLTRAQIEPFLTGELQEFGPSAAKLIYAAADNFLRPDMPKEKSPPVQGELF